MYETPSPSHSNDERPASRTPFAALLLTFGVVVGCSSGDQGAGAASATSSDGGTVAFTNARVFDGTGSPVQEGMTLLIRDGRVESLAPTAELIVPDGVRTVDAEGATIIPGLINTHGHVADVRGMESGHYDEENVHRQLGLYAAYGVTTVNSLGSPGDVGVAVREARKEEARAEARLRLSGPVVTGPSAAEAVAQVDEAHAMGVDMIKIRVDDNLGTTEKMDWEVVSATLERAHEQGLPLAAHLFYLDDAKALLGAGVDLVAHSIRDRPVDAAVIQSFLEHDVCYVPTLTRELSTFVYERVPSFFQDPFFLRHAAQSDIAALASMERQTNVRTSASAQAYKVALEIAQANLLALSRSGVRIAFGTDSGPVGRFQGYFEYLELGMMADAGLTPTEILSSATGDAAACLGLTDVGVLEPGRRGDLVVVRDDPLENVRNLRSLESVWVGGLEVAR